MIRICIRNTTKRPFLLGFLKKTARIEAAGTKFDTFMFKLSDIDNTRQRPVEAELAILKSLGCEIYLDTDMKRLVPAEVAPEKEAVEAAEPGEKPLPRNLIKAFGYEQDERALFPGTPSKGSLGPLQEPDLGREFTVSRTESMTKIPGATQGMFGQVDLDLEAMRKAQRRLGEKQIEKPVEPVAEKPAEPVVETTAEKAAESETRAAPAVAEGTAVPARTGRRRRAKTVEPAAPTDDPVVVEEAPAETPAAPDGDI
jgi:hypothetical protein